MYIHAYTHTSRRHLQTRTYSRPYTFFTVLLLEQRNWLDIEALFLRSDHIVLVDWWTVQIRRYITLYFLSAAALPGIHSSQVSLLGKNNTLPLPFKRESLLLCTEHELFFSKLFLLQWKLPWLFLVNGLYTHTVPLTSVWTCQWSCHRGEGHSIDIHLHFQ